MFDLYFPLVLLRVKTLHEVANQASEPLFTMIRLKKKQDVSVLLMLRLIWATIAVAFHSNISM